MPNLTKKDLEQALDKRIDPLAKILRQTTALMTHLVEDVGELKTDLRLVKDTVGDHTKTLDAIYKNTGNSQNRTSRNQGSAGPPRTLDQAARSQGQSQARGLPGGPGSLSSQAQRLPIVRTRDHRYLRLVLEICRNPGRWLRGSLADLQIGPKRGGLTSSGTQRW
jgi:hypothetical protein